MKIVGIRGAIVARENTQEAIGDATTRLVRKLLSENKLASHNIISMFFTMTPDLNTAFPAAAARETCGLQVPLLCASEIAVPGGLERVIRVLVHAYYPPGEGDVVHIYMDGAEVLRPDLRHGGNSK